MIGNMIDRAALTALGAAGFYLFFLNAGLGIVGSCMLAFVCMALLRRVIRNIPFKPRVTKGQAEAALLSIAQMGEDEAGEALITLTEQGNIIPILRHPQGLFTVDMLYEIWRTHGDGVHIVVTCPAEGKARDFARSRAIALTDGEALMKVIRRTGRYVLPEAPGPSLRSRLRPVWERPVRPRAAMAMIGLMLAYLATGRLSCLLCALALAGFAGAKLIERWA